MYNNLNSNSFNAKDDAILSGLLINGVFLFSSLSGDLTDPFFPKKWSGVKKPTVSAELVDSCLGHPGGNVYHYHTISPCLQSLSGV